MLDDSCADGVYCSLSKVHPASSVSSGLTEATTPPNSWRSAGAEEHHTGAPLYVRPDAAQPFDLDPEIVFKAIQTRSKELPTTWYYASNHVLVNMERTKQTTAPLLRSPELDTLARYHAECMADETRVHHSNLTVLQGFLQRTCGRLGENVARGDSIKEIHESMTKNRSQRNNMIDRRFTHFGMGTAKGSDGKLYLCQLYCTYSSSEASTEER